MAEGRFGKPHTAMTFAGAFVGRQPSWGCFGVVRLGPQRRRAGGRAGEASRFGGSMTRLALASPGFCRVTRSGAIVIRCRR